MVGRHAVIRRGYRVARGIARDGSRSITALLAGMVCLSVLTSVLIVGFLAWRADADANRLAAISISGAIDRERSRISNEAYINAHWDDAYAHAYGSMRDPWIRSQWGTPIGRSYVIDAHGRTLFAHLPEGHEPPLAQLIGSRTLAALLARIPATEADVRKRGDATVLLGQAGGAAALIAFSPIVREKGPATLDRSSYRIFVDIRMLDRALLAEWGKGFGLQDLQWLAAAGGEPNEASTDVRDWSGRRVGTITWTRLTPATAAIRELMPVFAFCMALFVAVAAVIARRVHSLNQELKAQSQAAAKAVRQEQEARMLADSDVLTGLYNRRRFDADLEAVVLPANVNALTIGLVDLDHFKMVNDTFGHHVGDCLLVEVAQRLGAAAGTDATLYRIGGDEFAMIARMGPDAAVRLAGRLCAAMTVPVQIGDQQVRVGASIGLGAYAEADLSSVELAERADQALYYTKREKPGGAVLFSSELERRVGERRQISCVSGGAGSLLEKEALADDARARAVGRVAIGAFEA
jgi:diguanylate cyclase (GGDEF)-like protein